MTEEEKQELIDAVNSKFPRQNLTEIYYNIGRALPFTAQRFPDGRVSDWYRNQYVEVVKVEPHGRGGKFSKVLGFYYRNGKRADAYENDPKNSWCTKDDTEPQPIPCCGCGSWSLIGKYFIMRPIDQLTKEDAPEIYFVFAKADVISALHTHCKTSMHVATSTK